MKIKHVFLLLMLVLIALGGFTVSAANAAELETLPVLAGGPIDLSQLGGNSLSAITWGDQRLWGLRYQGSGYNTIYQLDPLERTLGDSFLYARLIATLTWNGQNFLGSSNEVVWEFSPAGEEVGHYVRPQELAASIRGLAWDGDTPGGPYLWLLDYFGELKRTLLTDPLEVDTRYSLSPLMPGYTFSGLAWDGQYLWVIARLSYHTHRLLKIDPSDGSLVQAYVVLLPSYALWGSITADRESPGGPYLYLMTGYPNALYKLSTTAQAIHPLYMPFIPGMRPALSTATPYLLRTPTRSPTQVRTPTTYTPEPYPNP